MVLVGPSITFTLPMKQWGWSHDSRKTKQSPYYGFYAQDEELEFFSFLWSFQLKGYNLRDSCHISYSIEEPERIRPI